VAEEIKLNMSTPGSRFDELVSVMRTLRSPEGCPWDREQTLATLRPFLLEETYETLDAIDREDWTELREELGDLLFEVVFMAQICDEAGRFSVADALETVTAKLVRRHPHVFGEGGKLASANEVLGQWETIKRRERDDAGGGPAKTTLSGVPRTLPSLLRAYEYGSRAASVGFDWHHTVDVLDKIEEEVAELRQAVGALGQRPETGDQRPGTGDRRSDSDSHSESQTRGWRSEVSPAPPDPAGLRRHVEEEMGDLLFAIANLSRKLGVEPENALRRANDKFQTRFTELERRVEASGRTMKETALDDLEAEWKAVKSGL